MSFILRSERCGGCEFEGTFDCGNDLIVGCIRRDDDWKIEGTIISDIPILYCDQKEEIDEPLSCPDMTR